MSVFSKKRLKTSYRDQLIRELQHLHAIKQVKFSEEVTELMGAVEREQARTKKIATYRFWRRWLAAHSVRRDDEIVASDLYLLEATLTEHMDMGDLKIRIAGFRDMLSHLLTEESYNALSIQFRNLSDENLRIEELKAEARAIISRVYRRYEGVPAVESIRWRIAYYVLLVTTAITLGIALLVGLKIVSPVVALAAAGSIGAAISTVERLYRLDPRHEPFKTSMALDTGRFTLLMAPVLGAIFAFVLFMLIRAGLIRGAFFPDFKSCWGFLHYEMSEGCSDTVAKDMAMLVGWGFLAGWAERLVPDVLDKLAPQAAAGIRPK